MTALDATVPAGQPLLIRRAQLHGSGIRDVRIADGRIVAVSARLDPRPEDRIREAQGGLLLPGLHDHHAHLFASAAARASLPCGPPDVTDERSLRARLAEQARHGEGWVRGIGFHESVCALLDRHWLDAACAGRPVRIQHRSGMLWVLNSLALEQLRLAPGEELPPGAERSACGELSGRFFDLDAWLGERLARTWPALGPLCAELGSYGITGITDAGARNGRAVWEELCRACAKGELAQRLVVMGSEELDGKPSRTGGRIETGALKVYLREARLPDLELLVRRVRRAHAAGRAAAFHCVTRAELAFALAALEDAGTIAGDRIEHAAIADDHALAALATQGVAVVTQPHFIAERGDQYLCDVDPGELPLLYRAAACLRHGTPLAAGSDTPYGSADPWAAMRAAVERRTRGGVLMSGEECLTPSQALAMFCGDPHRPGAGRLEPVVGMAADLCLLDVPWERLSNDLDSRHVALTICNGRIAYSRASA